MGRRKVQIKRIENKSSRQVTFCKRRNGLIEKARQLSVLCESSVAVLVVSAIGKLYNSSSGDNMSKIIDRYKIQQADDLQTLEKLLMEENLVLASKVTEIWKQTFLVTRDETLMLPEYSFGDNTPETLSLLK
ncbi:agamous-like MADS-box protein AGL31 [Brassica napus]|uniref:agamous-like MADS-box protein AGL31 n=1 Tax=Brassica napus TaxID=3708 RepID=UPI002079897D|nr:agamous-like MADS-box protein AGL31 [Brassica napus]